MAAMRVDLRFAAALLFTSLIALAQQPSPAPTSSTKVGSQTQQPSQGQGKLVGNWQGLLQLDGGASRRLLFKITEDDGKYKGVFYSIDQGPGSIAISSIVLDGVKVSMEIKPLDWIYGGTLNPDGDSISGSRTQNGQTNVLNLNHVSEEKTWAIPEPPKAMPADANPRFDVVTVKPSDPNAGGGNLFTIRGRHVMTINTKVIDLITFGYSLQPREVLNAPPWMDQKYDIDGVPDVNGQPNIKQMRLLIQDALVRRFGLKFHTEQQEMPVYALSVAKSGPKMTVTADSPSAPGNFMFGRLGDLHVTNSTMKNFCQGMQEAVMDKPVVDQTGLTDRYDFDLKWTPDESQFAQLGGYRAPPTEDPNAPPSLYTALQEQVGLKMESTKAKVDVMVIDHIERPSAN